MRTCTQHTYSITVTRSNTVPIHKALQALRRSIALWFERQPCNHVVVDVFDRFEFFFVHFVRIEMQQIQLSRRLCVEHCDFRWCNLLLFETLYDDFGIKLRHTGEYQFECFVVAVWMREEINVFFFHFCNNFIFVFGRFSENFSTDTS